MQDNELDQLLARAAATPATPSPDLMDRVLADALALQPQAQALARTQPVPERSGFFARIALAFGGAPAMGGVAAAALFGIALGYVSPDTIEALAGGLIDSGTEEFFPSVDFLTTEG